MTLKPGDNCQLFRQDGKTYLQHFFCDRYRDGVITDCATGKVVVIEREKSDD